MPITFFLRNSRESQANGSSLEVPSRLPWRARGSRGYVGYMVTRHATTVAGSLTSLGATREERVMRFSGGGPDFTAAPTITRVSPE